MYFGYRKGILCGFENSTWLAEKIGNILRRKITMVKKETYTREEVIEMLKEMQMETSKCVGFIVGMVTQGWVIKVMLGQELWN